MDFSIPRFYPRYSLQHRTSVARSAISHDGAPKFFLAEGQGGRVADPRQLRYKREVTEHKTSRVLSFESWVTEAAWLAYARSHPVEVPHLLSDRSPCQDPFFDLFAPSVSARRPMITGLCRCLKNFKIGNRYIYVTRLCVEAVRYWQLDRSVSPRYFGVASIVIANIEPSHQTAAREFLPRRYVVAPSQTCYPPGLAHDVQPIAAVARESCIVHQSNDEDPILYGGRRAMTPDESTADQWRKAYVAYHQRQLSRQLRVAFCRFEVSEGREALATGVDRAPVFTPCDWNNFQLNVNGHHNPGGNSERAHAENC